MKQLKETMLKILELSATMTYIHTSVSPMLEARLMREGHTILRACGTTVKQLMKISKEAALYANLLIEGSLGSETDYNIINFGYSRLII